MYIYIYMYVCMYIHILIYVYRCVYIHTYSFRHRYIYIYVCISPFSLVLPEFTDDLARFCADSNTALCWISTTFTVCVSSTKTGKTIIAMMDPYVFMCRWMPFMTGVDWGFPYMEGTPIAGWMVFVGGKSFNKLDDLEVPP